MIQKCSCEHVVQDRIYGKGKRVFNKTGRDEVYRCTVCLAERKRDVLSK
jgi:hypothetical protein